jgi:hypothetical protein
MNRGFSAGSSCRPQAPDKLKAHQEDTMFPKLILAAVLAAVLIPTATTASFAEKSKPAAKTEQAPPSAAEDRSKDKLGTYEIQHIMQS